MKNNNQFFAMLSRMKYINRWGLMRNTMKEDIAQHSLEVAMIAHALVLIHNQHFCGMPSDLDQTIDKFDLEQSEGGQEENDYSFRQFEDNQKEKASSLEQSQDKQDKKQLGKLSAERAAVLAMYHDTTEIITGDLPTPIKYFAPQIRDSYKKVEEMAANQLLQTLPKELQLNYQSILLAQEDERELWRFVKAADKLSAYIKCLEETRVGNVDFEKAKQSTKKALDDMNIAEVNYFIEKFLPAYSLTLDEQA